MIIDCGACVHSPGRASAPTPSPGPEPALESACDDCVVSFLLGAGDHESIVSHVDDDHAAAMNVLAQSGLVPPLRLVRRPRAS
ncbi:MAG: hypothetical protein IPO93_14430 [Actinobacteria bacterium]|nr:hypothetical protein [Actinomycetota bacterium]